MSGLKRDGGSERGDGKDGRRRGWSGLLRGGCSGRIPMEDQAVSAFWRTSIQSEPLCYIAQLDLYGQSQDTR